MDWPTGEQDPYPKDISSPTERELLGGVRERNGGQGSTAKRAICYLFPYMVRVESGSQSEKRKWKGTLNVTT